MAKLTAKNSKVLAKIKRDWNSKIYKAAMRWANTTENEQDAIDYVLLNYVRPEAQSAWRAEYEALRQ